MAAPPLPGRAADAALVWLDEQHHPTAVEEKEAAVASGTVTEVTVKVYVTTTAHRTGNMAVHRTWWRSITTLQYKMDTNHLSLYLINFFFFLSFDKLNEIPSG